MSKENPGYIQQISTDPQTDTPTIGRRRILVALALSPLVLTGCAPSGKAPKTDSPDNLFPEGAEVPGARERLVSEINTLPQSPIKNALIERVLPYYQTQTPFVLNRSGLKINVYSSHISHTKTRGNENMAWAGLHKQSVVAPDNLHTTETLSVKMPLPGLRTSEELASVPVNSLAPDQKTPWIDFTINPQDYIQGGIQPEILITTTHPGLLNAADRILEANAEKFLFVKEACSFLFIDMYLEQMYKKSQELGLQTTVNVKDQKDNIREVEVLTTAWDILMQFGGRTKAITDLAGYVLALKALSGTSVSQELAKRAARYGPAINLLASKDLGTTPESILVKTIDLVMRSPEIQAFDHQGDISKIP